MRNMSEENPDIVIFTFNQNCFHLDGSVNRQIRRYLSRNNLEQLYQGRLYHSSVTAWVEMMKFGENPLLFFRKIVNSERYLIVLREFIAPEIRDHHIVRWRVWFRQDVVVIIGTSCFTRIYTIYWIRLLCPKQGEFLLGKVISNRGSNIVWSPNPPDLYGMWFFPLKVKFTSLSHVF